MAQLKEVSKSKHFGGEVIKYEHQSKELGCAMKFNAFLPPQALAGNKVPVLWFLSGRYLAIPLFYYSLESSDV